MHEQEKLTYFHMKDCASRRVLKEPMATRKCSLRDALLSSDAAHNRMEDAFSGKYPTLTFSPESLFFTSGQREKVQFLARTGLVLW